MALILLFLSLYLIVLIKTLLIMDVKSLYHYTSFDSFVKIWISKELLFNSVGLMNDICETNHRFSMDILTQPSDLLMKSFKKTIKSINSFKQISLTRDYSEKIKGSMSPYMWGHYGNKAKGICIELDYSKLIFRNSMIKDSVEYVEDLDTTIKLPFINNAKEIKEHIVKIQKNIFFKKLKEWEPENEFRIISDKDRSLNIDGAIKSVLITKPDSLECRLLEKLLDGKIPIMIFGLDPKDRKYKPYIYSLEEYKDRIQDYKKVEKRQKEANKKANIRRLNK